MKYQYPKIAFVSDIIFSALLVFSIILLVFYIISLQGCSSKPLASSNALPVNTSSLLTKEDQELKELLESKELDNAIGAQISITIVDAKKFRRAKETSKFYTDIRIELISEDGSIQTKDMTYEKFFSLLGLIWPKDQKGSKRTEK